MTQVFGTTSVGELASYVRSFERHLRATNRAPRTIECYLDAARRLVAFLAETGMPTSAAAVRREHVGAYIASVLERSRRGHRFGALPGAPAVLSVPRR